MPVIKFQKCWLLGNYTHTHCHTPHRDTHAHAHAQYIPSALLQLGFTKKITTQIHITSPITYEKRADQLIGSANLIRVLSEPRRSTVGAKPTQLPRQMLTLTKKELATSISQIMLLRCVLNNSM